jgi:putative inorganic carbon (HCO3(-)) transporter
LAASPLAKWLLAGTVGVVVGLVLVISSNSAAQQLPLIIAALLLPFAAMVVGLRRLMLALIILDIPLQFDKNFGYRDDVAALGGMPGFSISLTTVALVVLYTLWIADALVKHQGTPRPRWRDAVPLAVYVLCVAVSGLFAKDFELSLFQIQLLVQMLLLYVYLSSTVRSRAEVRYVFGLLLVMLLLEGALMIASRYAGSWLSLPGVKLRVDLATDAAGPAVRVGGTIGSPNTAAGFLSLLLVPAFSIFITWAPRWMKLLAAAALVAGLVAIIMTFSRGGWIALMISLVVFLGMAWYRGWLRARVPLLIALGALLLIVLFPGEIGARLTQDDAGSAEARVPLINMASRIIGDYPIFGVGANNYTIRMPAYLTSEFSQSWLYVVHNRFLLTWAESGIFAFLAFIVFIISTLWRGWQTGKYPDRFLAPLALGFTAAVVGHLYQMQVEVFNGRPTIQLLVLIAALITAMWRIASTAEQAHPAAVPPATDG